MDDLRKSIVGKKTLKWDGKDPELSLTLPSRYFFDEEIFRREIDTIIYPSWHFVCHKSEISNVGDFVKFEILKESGIEIFWGKMKGDDLVVEMVPKDKKKKTRKIRIYHREYETNFHLIDSWMTKQVLQSS